MGLLGWAGVQNERPQKWDRGEKLSLSKKPLPIFLATEMSTIEKVIKFLNQNGLNHFCRPNMAKVFQKSKVFWENFFTFLPSLPTE